MLERKDRAELNRAILKIASILKNLDNIPVDPRAFDMLEIAASLIEQQIEQNISYEVTEDGQEENAQGDVVFIEVGDEEREYDSSGFRFLDTNSAPSPEDLQEQFDIPWPFNP